MKFEEHSKAIAKSALAFNEAVMLARRDSFSVKTSLCGSQTEIYNVQLSRGCGDV